YGELAENGKSAVLETIRGLLSTTAICSIPAAKIGDEKIVIDLAGKLLKASDELSGSAAISSDAFKNAVTGEPMTARAVYRNAMRFRAIAEHVSATNRLPPFQGGMDRGVQRRLLVLQFNRVIPIPERIEKIGERIGEEEADQLLAFAVAGASRLISQREF